jgi:hypothetical protein
VVPGQRGPAGGGLAVTGPRIAVCLACICQAHLARAQSITTEAAVISGISSDDTSVSGAQVRAFGEVGPHIRYYAEAGWATSSDPDSGAFGAGYPYGNRVQIIESYAERAFGPFGKLVDVRAGRFHPPFGIYNTSDQAYMGFLRAPLIRYDGNFALSNNFIEQGAAVLVGVPWLTLEASLGKPGDVGAAIRQPGLDTVVRAQSSAGPFIVGVSHILTQPDLTGSFIQGRMEFTGLDVRWMRGGVQLRGEWIEGQPFDGTTTTGWYADAIVHRVHMGPVTAVARIEQLDYDTSPPFALHRRRQTVGARVRIRDGLSADVNILHQTGQSDEYGPAAIDLGVTYSVRVSPH